MREQKNVYKNKLSNLPNKYLVLYDESPSLKLCSSFVIFVCSFADNIFF